LLKDYDTNIQYHPEKANVVADALSRKSRMLANLQIEPKIIKDLKHMNIKLCIRDRLCVPSDPTLREVVLSEAHSSPFSIHPGSIKLYEDMKQHLWWNGMKQDIATYVGRCLICQQVKIEHQRASGLLQPLDILIWKWDFLAHKRRMMQFRLVDIFQQEIVRLHGKWDEYLYIVEFAYNNSWHASIKAAPYKLLYGQKCRLPICWNEVGERVIKGPKLIEVTNEKVTVAKEKLKEARSGQKSYADRHKRSLEFNPRDRVFLKVSPCRDRVDEFSYRLALPPQLSHVHNVSHISLLRGYKYHPLHVVSYPLDQIREDLSLAEEPEKILDRQERVMRNKTIPFIKILCKNHPECKAT
nr:hypothetical protein [Tanacetum cinerariifolium]